MMKLTLSYRSTTNSFFLSNVLETITSRFVVGFSEHYPTVTLHTVLDLSINLTPKSLRNDAQS
jgi:hypothetical protein